MNSPASPGGINRILQILRRDKKVSTYKFALLRGMVEIIDREPFLALDGSRKRGVYPLGLLVERWIYYYFPLLQSSYPQALGERLDAQSKGIAFRSALQAAIVHYPGPQGLTAFHHDYARGRIVGKTASDFARAATSIARTMTAMPMKHLGYSSEKRYYSVVTPERAGFRTMPCGCFDSNFLKSGFGAYKISEAYLEPLRQLGALVVGTDSILYQWAEFTADASRRAGRAVAQEEVLRVLASQPSDERDVEEARGAYLAMLERGEPLPCVWCGEEIAKTALAVDHVIPFSLWGDNSRFNLMPSHKRENSSKRAKIPSPELIERSRERIARYLLKTGLQMPSVREGKRPSSESVSSRPGHPYGANEDWTGKWVDSLKETCRRIIEERGYESWNR